MSWTEERIATLTRMWESGMTASQIAEELGGISRNAVIGKSHRLGLKPRPSPVKALAPAAIPPAPVDAPPEPPVQKAASPRPAAAPAPAPSAEVEPPFDPAPAPMQAAPAPVVPPKPIDAVRASQPVPSADEPDGEATDDDQSDENGEAPDDAKPAAPAPILRSVGPGGFLRQNPGEQAPPTTPAPPRRLVPARPSDAVAGKTSLLDLNDRICKWPIGHPGEPDFHFCGDKVNPGFPYCVDHCGHAYQAQLPRRDRRPPPPLPYGGPRVR